MAKSKVVKVADLNERDDLTFISDSQDVEALQESIGGRKVKRFDSFFVKVEDGEYVEVYGIEGIVPNLDKDATLI